MTVEKLLAERGATHGDYEKQAACADALRDIMSAHCNWIDLTPEQRDALLMIVVKISRILNGDPNHVDSWHDIAGYATLVVSALQRETMK